MSFAKKAVDSTIRRIFVYTAEIIASIFLLVIISLPLVFAIPRWFQHVFFGTPISDLTINPVAWFGGEGTFGIIILLAVLSIVIGTFLIPKLVVRGTELTTEDAEEESVEEDEDEPSSEDEDSEIVEAGSEDEETEETEETEVSEEEESED
ncbi:MAG: hypothetical protein ACXADL_02070 [Candidatus Thorarchaeota archaeon]